MPLTTILLAAILMGAAACSSDTHDTPTPTTTPTFSASPTSTLTSTATRSTTPTPTTTATLQPTATPTPTATPSLTQSPTATLSPTAAPRVCEFDRFGGCSAIQSEATGHFRTAQIDGVSWLITPAGNAYFSAGVSHTTSDGDYAPALGRSPYHDNVLAMYGSEAGWADSVVRRFARLGFNSLGAWSKYELFRGRVPYTIILGFAGRAPEVPGLRPGQRGEHIRDFFDPQFASGAEAEAEGARGCAADDFCIGAFSDNELGWGPGLTQEISFLDAYLRLPSATPGKIALQAFFEQLYGGDVSAFNAVWDRQLSSFDDVQSLSSLPRNPGNDPPPRAAARRAVAGAVAQRYFQVVHDALRAISPDLLILGSRLLAYHSSPAVVAALAPFVDVVSVNQYEISQGTIDLLVAPSARRNGYIFTGDLFADLDELHRYAPKPFLISEFGYLADDSGLPNSYPPIYPKLATQTERAASYESYMRRVLQRPYMVGAHWFEYTDQPAEGRFDGENDNWGIVDIHDGEYQELAARMKLVNDSLYQR